MSNFPGKLGGSVRGIDKEPVVNLAEQELDVEVGRRNWSELSSDSTVVSSFSDFIKAIRSHRLSRIKMKTNAFVSIVRAPDEDRIRLLVESDSHLHRLLHS